LGRAGVQILAGSVAGGGLLALGLTVLTLREFSERGSLGLVLEELAAKVARGEDGSEEGVEDVLVCSREGTRGWRVWSAVLDSYLRCVKRLLAQTGLDNRMEVAGRLMRPLGVVAKLELRSAERRKLAEGVMALVQRYSSRDSGTSAVLFNGVREVVGPEALAVWAWHFAQDLAALKEQRVCYTAEQFASRTFFTFNYGGIALVKSVLEGVRPPEAWAQAWSMLDRGCDEGGLREFVQIVTELPPNGVQQIADWQAGMHKRSQS